MKRHIQLSEGLQLNQLTKDEWTCVAHVNAEEVASLSLELSMLGLGTTRQLTLTSPGAVTFVLSCDQALAWPRAEVEGKRVLIQLNQRSLETLLSYLLVYYRDGQATVDHLDLEMDYQGPLGKSATFILKAADFAPSLSPEEAAQQIFKDR